MQPPGVVTGRYGTVGEAHLVDVPYWPLNTALYVKEFWGNSAAHIRHLLAATPMKEFSSKSAVPGVDRNDLHAIPVAIPDRKEQDRIVDLLDERLRRVDEVAARVNEQLDRLREYRQAIITAAVTGQLDLASETAA